MASDKPYGQHPFAQTNFTILKDRANLDRKPLAAIAAFMSAVVREVIDLGCAAMRAKCAMLPADSREMIYGCLLVGQGPHHLNEAVKVLFLRRVLFHSHLMAKNQIGSTMYIDPNFKFLGR